MTMTKILAIYTIVLLPRHRTVLRLTKHLAKPHLALCRIVTLEKYQQKGRKV